nr:Peptidase C54 [Hymenolepis microstoma]
MTESSNNSRSSTSLSENSATAEIEDPSVGDFFKSIWNQFMFGWTVTLAPRILPGIPITFLGKNYKFSNSLSLKSNDSAEKKAFETDFYTRLWFTYRESFPPLPMVSYPPITSLESTEGDLLNTTAVLRPLLRKQEDVNSLGSISPASSLPPTPKIPLSTRTSDCGWGCMIRSVQMLAAQAFLNHFLGRDWIYDPTIRVSAQDPSARRHRQIIRWFADSPRSPLSIHKLIQASGCPPGTHFGPAAVCRAFLIAMAWAEDEDLSQISIYFVYDRIIVRETALSLIDEDQTSSSKSRHNQSHPTISSDLSDDHVLSNLVAATSNLNTYDGTVTNEPKRGLLFLLPMRLGAGHRIDSNHVQTLLQLLQDPACVGLIGGRPRHSIYAPAVQSDRIFCLDPHFNQPTLDVSDLSEDSNFDVSSWHCAYPQKLMVRDLDPSMALGFYCGSRQEVLNLLDRLPKASQLFPTSPNSSPHQLIEVVNKSERARLFSHKSWKTQPIENLTNPYPPIDGENGSNQTADGLQGGDLDDEDVETCLIDF